MPATPNIYVDYETLDAFTKVAKTAKPGFIFVEAYSDGRVRLSAPGLNLTAWATGPAHVDATGKVAFEAAAFFKAVGATDKRGVARLNSLGIEANSFLAKLEPSDGRPSGHPLSSALSVSLRPGRLLRAWPDLLKAMCRDEARYGLYGIHVDPRGFLEATDGSRLFRTREGIIDMDENECPKGIIPTPAILAFDKAMKACGVRKVPDNAYLAIDEEGSTDRAVELCCSWQSGLRLGISCWAGQGAWPDSDEVFPKEHTDTWSVSPKLGPALAKLAKLGSGEATKMAPDGVDLVLENKGAKVRLAAALDGDVKAVGVNPLLLKDAVDSIEGPITLLLSGALSPMQINTEDGSWLVMPMRLD